nr:MAG TPA: hypothetical protein [Caudoviricetes sp.]DAX31538.1 MAG TPA: hypothetical protein [Caudoviricetes sp.]
MHNFILNIIIKWQELTTYKHLFHQFGQKGLN